MWQRNLALAAVSLSSLMMSSCSSNPAAPTLAERFTSCDVTTNDPQQPIAGCWVGTFDSVEHPADFNKEDPGCGGIGVPAAATFEHNGSSVTGAISAPNSCGFTHFAFEGTLQDGMVSGTLKMGQFRGTAAGSLSGGELELAVSEIVLEPANLFPTFPPIHGGTLHLHR